jgi:hypothetical protein
MALTTGADLLNSVVQTLMSMGFTQSQVSAFSQKLTNYIVYDAEVAALVASGAGTGTVPPGTGPAIAQYPSGTSTTVNPVLVSGDVSIAQGGAATVGAISGKPITLGGALVTAGSYSLTITLNANTNLVFPASGTVLTTSGNGSSLTGLTASQISGLGSLAPLNFSTGLGSSGGNLTVTYGTTSGTAAQGNDSRITGAAQASNNLSDLSSASTARGNLGLGALATQSTINGATQISGTIPVGNLPASVVGATHYLGMWNAAANSPTITSSTGPAGDSAPAGGYYVVSTYGTSAINGLSVWNVGDWIIWNGTVWEKLDGSANPVSSVAGRTGSVTLTYSDVGGLGNLAVMSYGTGLGSSGGNLTVTFGTTSGTVAQGNDGRIVGALQSSNNLSDLSNVVAALSNLGLGGTAVLGIGAGLGSSGGNLTVTYGTTSGTAAQGNDSRITGALQAVNNFTDLNSPSTARTNLGLGGTSVLGVGTGLASSGGNLTVSYGTTANTAAQGNDSRITGALQSSSNLSDVSNQATARTNLGLGSLATSSGSLLQTGTNSGQARDAALAIAAETAAQVAANYALTGLFGTGADGAVTLSAGTTTLTRDLHATNLTINGTAVLNPAGFRVFVSGILDISAAGAGAISRVQGAPTNASGSSAGVLATQQTGSTVGSGSLGVSGQGGTTGAGASGAGPNPAPYAGGNGGLASAGGAGTNSGGSAGASGYAIISRFNFNTPSQNLLVAYSATSSVFCGGGAGGGAGGAGGGDGTYTGGGSGAGGVGGGVIQLYAAVIYRGTNSTANIIIAVGGSGSNGGNGNSSGNTGGGGAGCGGGGGLVYIVVGALTGSQITNAINASGGAGGNGGNGAGTGAGAAGASGGASGSIQVLVLSTSTFTANTPNASGTSGGSRTGTAGGSGGAGATAQANL